MSRGPQREPELRSILAAIIESSEDAIYSKDAHARITSWNRSAERLYGYSEQEAVGRDIAMIIPPNRRGEERAILARILEGERIEHFETQRLAKDGTLVDVSIAVSPVHDRLGDIIGASVVGRDIRDRKAREVLEKELEKRDFIARAAHELKNPLTAISGMAQILQANEGELSAEDREMAYGSLIRQSTRANRLITDLLELARLDSGQVDINLISVDLREVVSGSIEAATTLSELAIDNRVDPEWKARADPLRLEDVFVNLFSNSAKYGASSVVVDANLAGDCLHVKVADDGPGVPEDLAPNVFEPFTRGVDATVEGSGLGLSIAKKLCTAFGGDIAYEPNEGGGATFVITLPAD